MVALFFISLPTTLGHSNASGNKITPMSIFYFLNITHLLNTSKYLNVKIPIFLSQFLRCPATHRAILAVDAARNRENTDRHIKFYWAPGPGYSTKSSCSGIHHNTATGDHWEALQNSAGAASVNIKIGGPRRGKKEKGEKKKKDGMLIWHVL